MKPHFLFFLLACSALDFSGCKKKEDPSIEKLLRDNLSYSATENIDGYLSTIHPHSPIFAQTLKFLPKVFQTYDLNYTIDSISVVSVDSEKALVRVTQTTTRKSGPAFRNNRLLMLDELRKSNGQWKLYNSTMEKIDYLD